MKPPKPKQPLRVAEVKEDFWKEAGVQCVSRCYLREMRSAFAVSGRNTQVERPAYADAKRQERSQTVWGIKGRSVV